MYNAEKGFGFVALSDGSGDAFLHVSALQASGIQSVAAGALVRVRVGRGQKGRQVEQVLSVSEGSPSAGVPGRSPGIRRPAPDGARAQVDLSSAAEVDGTVKWYNTEKGFGFISPEGGGKDVFVHATALQRAGLTALSDGQAVRMKVVQGQKGLEVAALSLV
jgi:CspA family cold shock protein